MKQTTMQDVASLAEASQAYEDAFHAWVAAEERRKAVQERYFKGLCRAGELREAVRQSKRTYVARLDAQYRYNVALQKNFPEPAPDEEEFDGEL
jgi:hypothetical protein